MKYPKLIVIAGPTCSGKNDLAIALAKKVNGIIINADSRQIYRDLNIGTAKPIPDMIKNEVWYIDNIPHYLYGFVNLETDYNIYKYQNDVKKIIEKNKDKVIFLVGGTGLYIDSVVLGYKLPKTNNLQVSNLSLNELQLKLGDKLSTLNESDRNNPRRLQSILQRLEMPGTTDNLKHLYLVIDIDKEILKNRISQRVNIMFENGLLEENTKIFEKYKDYSIKSLQTIGYQEFKGYFNNDYDLDTVKKLIITHTNQYSKRQKTWFKRNKNAMYINNYEVALEKIEKFLSTFN